MNEDSPSLPFGSEWSFESLERYDSEIGRVAAKHGLDCYRHQLEVITAEQMMDAYASIGMPVYYHHWSFGKHFLATEKSYKRGQMGLAYEIVINSDPCIVYLMEENTLPMQALVIAHAGYGHNSFFKGNYLFRTWTSAEAIIDYLVFARNVIAECEERYGEDEVEHLLDACHALMSVGVDRYKRPPKMSLVRERERRAEREAYLQTQVNDLWRTLPPRQGREEVEAERRFPLEPEENLLYFIEKNAPLLEPWQREIVRIVRKIGQYFYPQRQTQLMNEGYRTIRQRLADQYNLGSREPDIQVWNVDLRGGRSLTLRHFKYQGRPLGDTRDTMLRHVATLWGFPVKLEEQDESGEVTLLTEVKIDRRRESPDP